MTQVIAINTARRSPASRKIRPLWPQPNSHTSGGNAQHHLSNTDIPASERQRLIGVLAVGLVALAHVAVGYSLMQTLAPAPLPPSARTVEVTLMAARPKPAAVTPPPVAPASQPVATPPPAQPVEPVADEIAPAPPAKITPEKPRNPRRPPARKPAPAVTEPPPAPTQIQTAAIEATRAPAEPLNTASEPPTSAVNFSADYLQNPPPAYPLAARRRGLEGRVVLHVQVLENGRCGDISIKQSSGHELLDNAALQAVKEWRFIPAQRGDTAITARVDVPIHFKLEK